MHISVMLSIDQGTDMICRNCGAENDDGMRSCVSCGSSFGFVPPEGDSFEAEEDYLEMAWYHSFGTPPGCIGTSYLVLTLCLTPLLVFSLVYLSWAALAFGGGSWAGYAVAGSSAAVATSVSVAVVLHYVRTARTDNARSTERRTEADAIISEYSRRGSQ